MRNHAVDEPDFQGPLRAYGFSGQQKFLSSLDPDNGRAKNGKDGWPGSDSTLGLSKSGLFRGDGDVRQKHQLASAAISDSIDC